MGPGLSVVKHNTFFHGDSVSVKSEEGALLTFEIQIPAPP